MDRTHRQAQHPDSQLPGNLPGQQRVRLRPSHPLNRQTLPVMAEHYNCSLPRPQTGRPGQRRQRLTKRVWRDSWGMLLPGDGRWKQGHWRPQLAINLDSQTYPVPEEVLEKNFKVPGELPGDSACSYGQSNWSDPRSVVNPVGLERTREDSCHDRRCFSHDHVGSEILFEWLRSEQGTPIRGTISPRADRMPRRCRGET